MGIVVVGLKIVLELEANYGGYIPLVGNLGMALLGSCSSDFQKYRH